MLKSDRRQFIKRSLGAAAAFSSALAIPLRTPRVALVRCRTYEGGEVRAALENALSLVGGARSLVNGKTVTVKLNLTGQEFSRFLDLPVGETYMTHYATAYHLAALLLGAGARRLCFVESTNRLTPLEPTLVEAGWDLRALDALGAVSYENTRNRGTLGTYAHVNVPKAHMFSSFDLNRAYVDTDVMVSLAKLKQHGTTGVTLTMKNMFGITPNSMFGSTPGDENATTGRGAIHDARQQTELPGLKPGFESMEAGVRVPYTIVDVCGARPIDLAIIDGITAINHGESRYSVGPLMRVTRPGVLIAGTNAVSVDAVGTAVMGFEPRDARGTGAFAKARCENHLLLADQAGLGTADLRRIDIRGLTLDEARHPYS